ncbi:MAG: DUF349 domain-containing protein [Muribaculaceae bacterium]|nr:DUF349 domain-containing protein [Muribaculaceae bacterium]
MELREQPTNLNNEAQGQILNDGHNDVMNENNESENAMVADNDKTLSKESLIQQAEEILNKSAEEITRDELTRVKLQFHALRKTELEQEKAEFLEKGNEEAAFAPKTDEAEEKFKEILNQIKDKKAAYAAELEATRQANYERKSAIIAEITEMAADTDNVNRLMPRFRELQQEFKTVGEVPATLVTEQWKQFQEAVERFYDQLKINKDLRDYDFKKNLDVKVLLCEEAEKLTTENDVVVAFRRLQDLHDKWRETGPVAKEMREEIWNRFKDASAIINKKYQAFFEERKAREQENEAAKTAICERVEALDFESLKSHAAWEEMTKTIIAAQEDWKKLGYASKKMNNALFARFRETCDRFFSLKAEYFKKMKDELSSNLEKKIALCERAEALKDSTDWKKASDEFVEMQRQWKTIGSVAKKHSDAVWQRFLAACDYFFEQKKKNTSGTRREEQANLKAKNEIIHALNNIDREMPREEAIKLIKEYMAQWQKIGHVPFREKDNIYEAYRAAINALHDHFDMRESRAHIANFESTINDMGNDENRLYRERERLMRALEQKRNELRTYENNLGFFNSKSKTGNSMFREMERKMQRIKDDIAMIEKKIGIIDSKL